MQLMIERQSQARSDVQQRQKAWRIEATAVAQSAADDLIVIRSNGFEYVQETDWGLQLGVGTADEARGVEKIALGNVREGALQFKSGALHQQLGSLMDNLKGEFVLVE